MFPFMVTAKHQLWQGDGFYYREFQCLESGLSYGPCSLSSDVFLEEIPIPAVPRTY